MSTDQSSDTIAYCGNCKTAVDYLSINADCLKFSTMPNTLTNLKDHNNVDWKCPACGYWNNSDDQP